MTYWKYKISQTIQAGGFCLLCGSIQLEKITAHHILRYPNEILLALCHKCHIAHNGKGQHHLLSIGKSVEKKLIAEFNA